MINTWWVSRPKRKLNSIPEVLGLFAELSLGQQWSGQRSGQLAVEDALEEAGLKREGTRRDQGAGGARTYYSWLMSYGLVFTETQTKQIRLTLAGEAIMNGENPVTILKNQVLKYQFPSAFSVSRGVRVSERFKVHPFRAMLRLMTEERLGYYLTEEELAKIVITEYDSDSDKCHERIIGRIIEFREKGDSCLSEDFFEKYLSDRTKRSRAKLESIGGASPNPYGIFTDTANTFANVLEYTQLIARDGTVMKILPEKKNETERILAQSQPFIPHAEDQERYQRQYGLDPKHTKDTRNLLETRTVTPKMLAEQSILKVFMELSLKRPVGRIDKVVIDEILERTGLTDAGLAESVLVKNYPHGSIDGYLSNYFEMAFRGRDDAIDFEKATTTLFREVFGFRAIHLGQTGAKSAPDVLVISDEEGYQAILDNKAYSEYSITGDHRNRMIHNYLGGISNYSDSEYPVGWFVYLSGGFGRNIDKQLLSIAEESGINGCGLTVTNFIRMIKKNREEPYTHKGIRDLFTINRQILISDL